VPESRGSTQTSLIAEGVDGASLFRRSDIDHLATRRPRRWPSKRPRASEPVELPTADSEPAVVESPEVV